MTSNDRPSGQMNLIFHLALRKLIFWIIKICHVPSWQLHIFTALNLCGFKCKKSVYSRNKHWKYHQKSKGKLKSTDAECAWLLWTSQILMLLKRLFSLCTIYIFLIFVMKCDSGEWFSVFVLNSPVAAGIFVMIFGILSPVSQSVSRKSLSLNGTCELLIS